VGCFLTDNAKLIQLESLDNPIIHDLSDASGRRKIPRELVDSGVKFASWGRSADRLYTGSSDGKVKAWDIRKPKGHAFVRTVLSVTGGVSAGAFSKDYSKLLIGDATGKVHLLEVDDSDPNEESRTKDRLRDKDPQKSHSGSTLPTKRPKVIIPHSQPDPPPGYEPETELTAQEMSSELLQKGQLILHHDPMIGAVQGPRYDETPYHNYEAHEQSDVNQPLKSVYQPTQRFELQSSRKALGIPRLPSIMSSDLSQHAKNVDLDFDFSRLSLQTQREMARDGWDLDWDPVYEYELVPPSKKIFKEAKEGMIKARQKRNHNI
jgi:hypothetical protein